LTADRHDPRLDGHWPANGRIAAYHTDQLEVSANQSPHNEAEAQRVREVVHELVAIKDIGPEEISVLCPYRGQQRKIRDLFRQSGFQTEVYTIDQFQVMKLLFSMVLHNLFYDLFRDEKITTLSCH